MRDTIALENITGFKPGDAIYIGRQAMIVDEVGPTSMTVRRPILGDHIAWAILGLWYALAGLVGA